MKTGSLSLTTQYPCGLKPFRSVVLFIILLLIFRLSLAQTTPISGIVNSYYQVIDIVPSKACVRVPNPAGLNHNDKVMLIQMKGATINTTANSSSFGDTLTLNNAGNYEIATVCHVVGDSVFMVYVLLNDYTVSGKVQLVKIPQYINADITDTLKPAPWNNTTGTGGVLAISVEEDLILNAPVYADSSGYRGGEYRLSDGTCGNLFPPAATDYAYNANNLAPQDGAFKGEGVADVTAAQSGGRGAPANGGGGGNNHNNGGGGGANLSRGGDGGGNSSSGGCRTNLLGRSGKALSSYSGKKIFFGGGGGAGQANNGFVGATGGGHGGGIIFIEAGNLIGNNRKISASGQRGGNAIGDGASGGGAGGTIILSVGNYIGNTTIEANGNQGGSVNNQGTAGRCYGGGGGGSGGVIYFSSSAPPIPINVNPGAAGLETARSATCNPPIPPQAGLAGQVVSDYTYSSSHILENSYCGVLLPVSLVWFKVTLVNNQTILKWEIGARETVQHFIIERSQDGRNWVPVAEQRISDNGLSFQEIDPYPQPGINYYRLKMIDQMDMASYSIVRKIFIPTKNDVIKVYPNPANGKVWISGHTAASSTLSMFDLSGKLIWEKTINASRSAYEVDLPALSKGVYLLKIGSVIKKLVIR